MSELAPTETDALLYCSFWLGAHCFGVPASAVSEVHAPVPLTRIPGAPSAVRGYVNLRGQLYLVLDPAELLLGTAAASIGDAELIVFRTEIGEAFVIAVDRVGDMLPIPPEQIHVPKARTGDVDLTSQSHRLESLVAGHATLEEFLVTLVEPRKLLPAAFSPAGIV